MRVSQCIEATAGSGKTTLMIRRIVSLVTEHHASPNSILAITFTKKAATQMRDRLMMALTQAGQPNPMAIIQPMMIDTIDAFCHRLIKRHGLLIHASPDATLLQGMALTQRLRSHMTHLWQSNRQDPPAWLSQCLSMWSMDQWMGMMMTMYSKRTTMAHWMTNGWHAVRGDDVGEDALVAYDEACGVLQASYEAMMALVACDKIKKNWMDYTDALIHAYQLLANVDWVRHDYQHRLQHIFVDEFQDTSLIQWKMVHLLCGDADPFESGKLWVIGDRCQAIYGFRGADDALMGMIIDTDHPQLKHVTTTHNYRSDPVIVGFVNALFERLFRDQGAPFLPMIPHRAPDPLSGVSTTILANQTDELTHITHTIRDQQGAGVALHDMAILVRKNADVAVIQSWLNREGIPVQVSHGSGLCEWDSVQIVIHCLMGWLDGCHDVAWYGIATDVLGLSSDHIQALRVAHGSLYRGLVATHPRVQAWREACRTGDRGVAMVRLVWALPLTWSDQDVMAVTRLLDEFMVQWRWRRGDGTAMMAWFDSVMASPKSWGFDGDTATNAVHVMTLHRAKGLEFLVVMVPFLHASFNMGGQDPLIVSRELGVGIRVPTRPTQPIRDRIYADQKKTAVLEELRLFYVTLTRAKRYVALSGQALTRKNTSRLRLMMPYMQVEDTRAVFLWEDPGGMA